MWLLLLLFIVLSNATTAVQIRDIVLDAATPVIALETNNWPGYVVRVEWCRSLYSNSEGAAIDINNCKAPGLMHMTLYPNAKRRYIKDSSTSTMFVERSDIGGHDDDHQFNIIVRTRALNGTEYETVYRFNPLFTTTLAPSSSPPPSSSSSIIVAGVPNRVESNNSWKVALSVFCIGMAVIAGVAFTLHRRGFGFKEAIVKNIRIYGGGYEFTTAAVQIPEEDFLSVESEQEILRNLGIGANEAYEENFAL